MFVIANENTKMPIKVWLEDETHIDELCLEQAYHLANLPFVHKWVSLMPDTHAGMGMPIGGVIATTGVIIPNAVGVDIGCGMAFAGTNLKVDELREVMTGNGSLIQTIIGDILRNIPVGFNRHKSVRECATLDVALGSLGKYEVNPELVEQLEAVISENRYVIIFITSPVNKIRNGIRQYRKSGGWLFCLWIQMRAGSILTG